MRKFTIGTLVTGMCVMLAGAIVAQQAAQDRDQRNQSQQSGHQAKQACLASKLMEMTVRAQNEECGMLKDLVIGSDGSVKYLVIAPKSMSRDAQDRTATNSATRREEDNQNRPATDRTAAASGQHGEFVIVPWDLAKFEAASPSSTAGTTTARTGRSQFGAIVLNIEKSRLEQAPKFSKSELEQSLQQESEIAKVEQFFGSRRERGAARPELNQNRDDRDSDSDRSPNPQDNN